MINNKTVNGIPFYSVWAKCCTLCCQDIVAQKTKFHADQLFLQPAQSGLFD